MPDTQCRVIHLAPLFASRMLPAWHQACYLASSMSPDRVCATPTLDHGAYALLDMLPA